MKDRNVYFAVQSTSFTEVKSVKYKGTTKDATCDITVEYTGTEVVQSGCSVSCTIAWPTNKELDKDVSINVGPVGDVLEGLINVDVSFNLYKKQNKPASKTKARDASFTGETYVGEEAASYPADLWCPAEDKIIFGDNGAGGVANETLEEDWQGCALQCATYTNSAGNAPCFSWTFNKARWSTLIGRAPTSCIVLLALAVLCHKEPARRIQRPY